MSWLTIILIVAAVMVGLGVLAVVAWLVYGAYLDRLEQRLAVRKGFYRAFVSELATRERELLTPTIRTAGVQRDFAALEAVLEEQARGVTERPAWLLDAYDRLGLVDKYVERLRRARRWRERAFAAELLGRVGNAKALPALLETVQATRTEDSDVREIALRALARIADPRAVEPLVQALRTAEVWLAPRIADILTRHGDLVVEPMIAFLEEPGRHPARAWAANILGEVKAQSAFPALIRALGDLEDEVRAKAAFALGRLGDRRAVPYLLEHLLSDPAPFVRARIAAALGQFGDPEVIDRLVRSLGDPAWWVRMRSVEALEQSGDAAEGPLLVALDDPDAEIRIRAAVALERLGVAARIVTMVDTGDRAAEAEEILAKFAAAGARELMAELLLHRSIRVRAAAITAIRRSGRQDLAHELTTTAAGDASPEVRAAAFDALRTLGITAAVPAALRGMVDPAEAVRTAAIRLLGDLGDPAIAGDIRARTADPEPTVRAAAAHALGVIDAPDAVPDLGRLLGDSSPLVRQAAIDAAAQASARRLAPQIVPLLGDTDESVRLSAARALGRLGDATAVAPLVRAFETAGPPLREAITVAVAHLEPVRVPELAELILADGDTATTLGLVPTLARLPSTFAVRVLAPLCRSPQPEVRAAAISAIAGVESPDAPELAVGALRDPDDRVRAAAIDASIRLGAGDGAAVLELLARDPSELVRERAALAVGLLQPAGGEELLLEASDPAQPLSVRAAAVLALGAYGNESMVARVASMSDDAAVRAVLQQRLRHDAEFRLLAARLRHSRSLELRALAAMSREQMETELADGMRSVLDARERIRLVAGLRAFQGERSRTALLQVVRGDPSPEVRASALGAVAGMLDPAALGVVARRALGDPDLSVRRSAVSLFSQLPPAEAIPALLQSIRADDDPAVLQAVAAHAAGDFDAVVDLVLAGEAAGREAVVAAQVARYIDHPGIARLLPPMAQSSAPAVRAALADLLATRPELASESLVRALAADPVVEVRRHAARAAAAARFHEPLAGMAGDPDADVRRDVAVLLQGAPAADALARLRTDADPRVRAAAAVSSILRGEITALPANVARTDAAEAVVDSGALADLRRTARTSPDERHRLAAGLALALVGDQVAREVAASDPVPAVRTAVTDLLTGGRP
jgi:HEAT repeat protein